jgi:RNA polymerase sigma-54 factor
MSGPGFSQDLRQRQTQSLVLAPQLRHSLKILQVAALDLRSVIQEELQSNPTLEELPMEGVSLDKPAEDANNDGGSESSDAGQSSEASPPADNSEGDGKRDEMDFSRSSANSTKTGATIWPASAARSSTPPRTPNAASISSIRS